MDIIFAASCKKMNTAYFCNEKQGVLYQVPYTPQGRMLASLEMLLAGLAMLLLIFLALFTALGINWLFLWLAADLLVCMMGYVIHRLLERSYRRLAIKGRRLNMEAMDRDQLRSTLRCFHARENLLLYRPLRDPRGVLPIGVIIFIFSIVFLLRNNSGWRIFMALSLDCLQFGLFGIYLDRRYGRVKDRCAQRLEELHRKKEEEYRDFMIEQKIEEEYRFLDDLSK